MKLWIAVLACMLLAGAQAGEGLQGKVMCGYQGWFRAPSDGADNGWHHYASGKTFDPSTCSIELWPETPELPPASRIATPFKHPDGSAAEVYSSVDPAAINLHFRWMQANGIDGVFLQRFATTTRDPRFRGPMDRVMESVAKAAGETKRAWSVMYDLSGIKPGQIDTIIEDWKRVDAQFGLRDAAKNPAYLRHRGKPLVALWGLGFSDRDPMLDDWRKLLTFLKDDPQFGGCSILVGVPTFWRTLNRDAIKDPQLQELIALADVVSPWTVGRFPSPEKARSYAAETVAADVEWCRSKHLDFIPVAFPGFSWHNLMARRGKPAPLNAIPRLGGAFFWAQAAALKNAGAQMLYVAMFDELDEGTAIFKVRQDPPSTPETPFVAEPGVPGDQYLWLAGQAGRLMRGEIPGDERVAGKTEIGIRRRSMPEEIAPVIEVQRQFAAAAESLFDAWILPEKISRWMFGPSIRDEEILHIKTDPRPEGRFSFLVRRNGQELDHVGTYREVARPHRLVFTWGVGAEQGDASVVTVSIVTGESGSLLKLSHRMHPDWAAYADRTKAGWTRMLEQLAVACE